MADLIALVTTQDQSVGDAVRQAIHQIADLRLEVAPTLASARQKLASADVVLLFLHLSDAADAGPIVELLRSAQGSPRPVPVVVLSDRHRPEDQLELLRSGAADCLDRPLDLNRLTYLSDVLTVRARYAASCTAEAKPEVTSLGDQEPFLYVASDVMEAWMAQVRRVAPREATVLLTGETGTGKTRLARLIHELSPRREQPFVTVNCGALSASLLESELFGHVKGAFTGAVRDRAGKFAEVGRGTLLLDDVDALPTDLQAKLLRVVEEHVFEPVGSNRQVRMEARLIVASNRVLEQEAAAGRLRMDLYYRLNVVGFHLPPLRDRREVIAPLVDHFLRDYVRRAGQHIRGVAPAALRVLQDYDWPGNIRELRNVIERAVALCTGIVIEVADLPATICAAAAASKGSASLHSMPANLALVAGTLAETREDAEAQHIAEALQRHKNNRKRVAAELGISRMTLYKKLHRYGLMEAAAG